MFIQDYKNKIYTIQQPQFNAKMNQYNKCALVWITILYNLARLCEGLPQPKLRFMVGDNKKKEQNSKIKSIEIRTTLVLTMADQKL